MAEQTMTGQQTSSGRLTAAFRTGPLAERNFRLLAGGQFTSTIGDFCYAVALPWLVLSNHGSTLLLGTVLACYGVPRTVLIPVGGLLADKIGPRRLMLWADVLRCALVAALAVLAARHTATLAALGPAAAVIGAGEGLFVPASFAIMPTLLDESRLQAGNGIFQALQSAGSLFGPALGGALVATAGTAPAFWVDAATFAASAVSLALIRTRQTVPDAAEPAAAEPAAAATSGGGDSVWRMLRRERVLQLMLLVVVAANFALAGTGEVALPALSHLRFGAGGFGALIACGGAGSVLGAVAAARASGLRRPSIAASLVFLGSAVAIGLVPYLGGLPGGAAAMLVFGAGVGFGNVVFLTMMQKWAPPASMGRLMGLIMLAAMGMFPVSAALAGLLVRHVGPAPFFPVAGAVLGVVILFMLSQRELREFGSSQG